MAFRLLRRQFGDRSDNLALAAAAALAGVALLSGPAHAGYAEARSLADQGEFKKAYAEAKKGKKAGDMNAAAFVAGLDLTLKLDPKRSQEDAVSELIQLGSKGSAEACYWRGRWEELRGEFVQAFQSYTCGAVKNHHESLLARGDLYEKGRVPMATNPQMDAWSDYGMAAEAGSARAWVLLGKMRETGSVIGHQDVPGAWAFYSVALRKLPPGEKVFREFAQGRVAAAEKVLNPFGMKVAREAAEAGLRGGPKALVARELDLLEASAKQRDDDKLAAERDAAARRPVCQPSTDAAVECEGPRVR